jgi:hypothetical protein
MVSNNGTLDRTITHDPKIKDTSPTTSSTGWKDKKISDVPCSAAMALLLEHSTNAPKIKS